MDAMPAQPDLILWGAQMRTLDPDLPSCTAVAIKDGLILRTGDDDSLLAMRGPGTAVVDARGTAFVPGLTDSHIHPLLGAIQTRGVNLYDAGDLSELRARIARQRQRTGEGWVIGWGLHYEPFEDTGIRGDLFDDVTQGQPMLLSFFDGHTDLANAAALAQAGVTGPVEFKEEATVVCVDGVPTGELRESAALRLVRSVVPEPDADTLYGLFAEAFRRFNQVGLTGLHAMDGSPGELDIYRRLEANGDLRCRVVVPMWQKPDMSLAEMRDHIPFRDERGHLWRVGVAKFFIDGVIETGTAWMVAPGPGGQGQNSFWPEPERYEEGVVLFAGARFQCATHAVGDRAVKAALDA